MVVSYSYRSVVVVLLVLVVVVVVVVAAGAVRLCTLSTYVTLVI